MLYGFDERGDMTLVEATPKEHRALSSFRLPRGGGGHCWAHPVVCGSRLHVRHGGPLFAYDLRAEWQGAGPRKVPAPCDREMCLDRPEENLHNALCQCRERSARSTC